VFYILINTGLSGSVTKSVKSWREYRDIRQSTIHDFDECYCVGDTGSGVFIFQNENESGSQMQSSF